MKQLDSDYVARYEYACSLIAKFFERELIINVRSKNDKLFDTNSIPQILFTMDCSKLTDDTVRAQVEHYLVRLNKDEGDYLLARIHGVIVDCYSILGTSFMNELISNTTSGIVAASGSDANHDNDNVRALLTKHPELLVFIMGNKIYQQEFVTRKFAKQEPAFLT